MNKRATNASIKPNSASATGSDLSSVRVQTNSAAPKNIQAPAYSQGNQIHLKPGQDKHLPHEATHVVQQRQGTVRPTGAVNGMPVNNSPGLERQADAMGARAAHGAIKKNATE